MGVVDTKTITMAHVIGLEPEAVIEPGVYGYRAVDKKWQYFYEEDFPIPFEIDDKARAYALFTAPATDTYAGDAELIDPDGEPRGTVYSDFYGHLEAGGEAQVFSDLVTIDKKGTWKIHFVIRLPETDEVLVDQTWDAIAVEVPPCTPGDTKCIGPDLYECEAGQWVLVERNAPQCVKKPFPWHYLFMGGSAVAAIGLGIKEAKEKS